MNKKNTALFSLTIIFLLIECRPLSGHENKLFKVNEKDIKNSNELNISQLLPVYVSKVIDGDTIIVEIDNPPAGLEKQERVRFLGVDTPETVAPGKQVEYFGKEASDYTKWALEKKWVYLAFDWDLRDRYGRLLAYIYVKDGVCFNAVQVRNGYAFAYKNFRFQFLQEFSKYEEQAKKEKAGLWGGL